MKGYRFYPLAEHPRAGIITSPHEKPCAARFLTVEQARALAQQSRKIAA